MGLNTHNQGSNPIDGIFIPTTLIPAVTSGYLAFGKGIPSNHRAIWINVPLAALGWFNMLKTVITIVHQMFKMQQSKDYPEVQ